MNALSPTHGMYPSLSPTHDYRHGLVIGKFYPPHNGHVHLITEAAKVAQHVTVLVIGSQYQQISVEDRANWLRSEVPSNAKVVPLLSDIYDDYVDERVWEAHDRVMKAKLREVTNMPVNVVISSEEYGDKLSTYFPGAANHVVDQKRITHPISGTMARADLAATWEHLPVSTRKGLIPRVIVVGAESTGTTTLAKALSEHYNARYVPEYGRDYTIEWLDTMREATPEATMNDLVWRDSDFERIAKYQTVLENRAAAKIEGFPLVVGDTDAFATALWASRYLYEDKSVNAWRSHIGAAWASEDLPRRDLYILTDDKGVEFEDDGYRDGAHIRSQMTTWFEDALTRTGKSWVLVGGTHEERMTISTKMIDRIIEERLSFR